MSTRHARLCYRRRGSTAIAAKVARRSARYCKLGGSSGCTDMEERGRIFGGWSGRRSDDTTNCFPLLDCDCDYGHNEAGRKGPGPLFHGSFQGLRLRGLSNNLDLACVCSHTNILFRHTTSQPPRANSFMETSNVLLYRHVHPACHLQL